MRYPFLTQVGTPEGCMCKAEWVLYRKLKENEGGNNHTFVEGASEDAVE